MFSLGEEARYWLYSRPVNMRMRFNGLSGMVTNQMGMDVCGGDAFIFINSRRNLMKILVICNMQMVQFRKSCFPHPLRWGNDFTCPFTFIQQSCRIPSS